MNAFDFILLANLLIIMIVGYFRGLLYQLLTLLALVLSVFLSIFAASPLTRLAAGNELLSEINTYYLVRLVTAGAIYFLLSIFVWYLDARLKKSGIKEKPFNRVSGFVFATVKGLAITFGILLAISFVDPKTIERHLPSLNRSYLLGLVREHNPFPHAVIVENLDQLLKLTAEPDGAERLEKILKKRGAAAKNYLGDLKNRRILPLIRDNYFRRLLSEKDVFKE